MWIGCRGCLIVIVSSCVIYLLQGLVFLGVIDWCNTGNIWMGTGWLKVAEGGVAWDSCTYILGFLCIQEVNGTVCGRGDPALRLLSDISMDCFILFKSFMSLLLHDMRGHVRTQRCLCYRRVVWSMRSFKDAVPCLWCIRWCHMSGFYCLKPPLCEML